MSDKDLDKENLLNRKPADMHNDGVRFTEDQLAKKERRERQENKENDKKQEKKDN